jgi:hypothetical protein
MWIGLPEMRSSDLSETAKELHFNGRRVFGFAVGRDAVVDLVEPEKLIARKGKDGVEARKTGDLTSTFLLIFFAHFFARDLHSSRSRAGECRRRHHCGRRRRCAFWELRREAQVPCIVQLACFHFMLQ